MAIDTSLSAASVTTPDWEKPITDEELAQMDPMNPTHALVAVRAWVLILGIIPENAVFKVGDTFSIEIFLTSTAPSLDRKWKSYIALTPDFYENLKPFRKKKAIAKKANAATPSLWERIGIIVETRFFGAYVAAIMKKCNGRVAGWVGTISQEIASSASFLLSDESWEPQMSAEALQNWKAGFQEQAYPGLHRSPSDWLLVDRDDESEGEQDGFPSSAESFVMVGSQDVATGADSRADNGSALSSEHTLAETSTLIQAYAKHLEGQVRAASTAVDESTR